MSHLCRHDFDLYRCSSPTANLTVYCLAMRHLGGSEGRKVCPCQVWLGLQSWRDPPQIPGYLPLSTLFTLIHHAPLQLLFTHLSFASCPTLGKSDSPVHSVFLAKEPGRLFGRAHAGTTAVSLRLRLGQGTDPLAPNPFVFLRKIKKRLI